MLEAQVDEPGMDPIEVPDHRLPVGLIELLLQSPSSSLPTAQMNSSTTSAQAEKLTYKGGKPTCIRYRRKP